MVHNSNLSHTDAALPRGVNNDRNVLGESLLLRGCLRTSAYIGCEKTVTGAMGLRMRRNYRLDRACAVFYRQLSDISVAVRH